MGLFGFVGDLLGGGSSTQVQQQVTNTTNTQVGVQIDNNIDLTPVQQALTTLQGVLATSAQQQADTSQQNTQAVVQAASSLGELFSKTVAAEQQQTQAIAGQVLPWVRIVGGLLAVFLLNKIFKGKK